jgi:hypothetical protein
MGDRFVMLRMDSTTGRMPAGQQSLRNIGQEGEMRGDLARVVAGVLANVNPEKAPSLTEDEQFRILVAADVVTLARTGVERDYRGDVIDAHAPEMPTRFTKQLGQVFRRAVAVGMTREDALRLAIRCARDSMPPLRLAILLDVMTHPGAATREIRQRLGKPYNTVDRELQALHMLGVLACDEADEATRGGVRTVWRYRVADEIDPRVLDPIPDLSVPMVSGEIRESEMAAETLTSPTDISGIGRTPPAQGEHPLPDGWQQVPGGLQSPLDGMDMRDVSDLI